MEINSLIYLCAAVLVVVVIISVILSAVRKKQKNIAGSPNLTYETRSSRPAPDSQRKPANIGSPATTKRYSSGIETSGHIFISYRRSDSADIAGRIYDRLVDRFGKTPIFKDVDSIPLGFDFKEYLGKKVSECNALLAIIGDRWMDASDAAGKKRLEDPADFVRIEIESALERGIPVIPLLVRGAQMPPEEHLPIGLRKLVYRNGIPIRPDPDFHNDMNRLIAALEKYLE
jgi:TIR domain-containing protein